MAYFFLAHNRFLEYWLLNIPVQGTSQEFCTKPRPTTHSRDGRRFGVYSESRKYYDNPTKRRVMLPSYQVNRSRRWSKYKPLKAHLT